MGEAELFAYLSAFVIIVLAVAMGDLVQSLHRLLRARRNVRWSGPPLIFAAIAAIIVVSEFFSLWEYFAVTRISLLRLLWLLLTPTVFALLAYAALPDDVPPEGLDLWQFHLSEKGLLCLLYAVGVALDSLRTWESASGWQLSLGDNLLYIWLPMLIMLLPAAIIGFTRKPVWQWVGIAGLLAGTAFATLRWDIVIAQ